MLKALTGKVIVEPLPEPEQSSGGIWIPEQAQSRINQGLVKYIGPDVKTVQIGDHVMFSGYSGSLMKLEGEGLVIIIPEKFIEAILIDEPYEVPGLYFKDKTGQTWAATYEMAMTLIAKACRESDNFRRINTPKPDRATLYAQESEE